MRPTVAALALLLTGCAVSDSTRYYMLVPLATDGAAPAATAGATAPVVIGIGPVVIPSYLDRSQIVTRTGPDRVEISAFHRWAEPLDEAIASTLASDVAALAPADRVVAFPWRGAMARSLDYQVLVVVLRFDGAPGSDVMLDARWRILGKDGREVLVRRSTHTEATGGSGFGPMVTAMNRTLRSLSQEIARALQARPSATPR